MKYIVTFNDIHLGLVTSDIDRTEEIVELSLNCIKRAIKLKKKGHDVIIVIGGDVFDHNNPSEYLIGQFLRILNLAVKYGIEVYVNVGNHDAISKDGRRSCLDFIKKLKGDYECVHLIDDITTIKWFTSDIGYVYLTFFPHITKSHLKGTDYKTAQEYIDGKADDIWEEVGQGQHQVVFSHLNVKGMIPGSEENLLKKSEVYLPDSFVMENESMGRLVPTIVQAHIHTRQKDKNVNVVGSQLYCDFGEKEKHKYFAVIKVPTTFGEKSRIKYVESKCRKFIELEFDFTDGEVKIDAKKYKKKIKDAVVKLNVILSGEDVFQDWEKVRKEFGKYAYYVKPVLPRIIRSRIVRNKKQSIDLDPKDAVKVWMKRNKHKGWKRQMKLAYDFIDGVE